MHLNERKYAARSKVNNTFFCATLQEILLTSALSVPPQLVSISASPDPDCQCCCQAKDHDDAREAQAAVEKAEAEVQARGSSALNMRFYADAVTFPGTCGVCLASAPRMVPVSRLTSLRSRDSRPVAAVCQAAQKLAAEAEMKLLAAEAQVPALLSDDVDRQCHR